jgi:hypothetical protein
VNNFNLFQFQEFTQNSLLFRAKNDFAIDFNPFFNHCSPGKL